MRDRIFISVDLPAPLRPTTASTSPRFTSNATSRSAQNSSALGARLPRRHRTAFAAPRYNAPAPRAIASRKVPYCPRLVPSPMRYFFPSRSARMTTSAPMSEHIGKVLFGAPEIGGAEPQKGGRCRQSRYQFQQVERAAENAPAEAVDDSDQRIAGVPHADWRRDNRGREPYR